MLIGTVIFLSLVVILLAMPVTLTYQLSWRQTLSASARLDWAFGLVRTDITPDRAIAETDKTKVRRKKTVRRRKSKGKKANVTAAIRQPAFRRRMFRFVSDVWRAIHKKNVELFLRLGLGDPADTGQLWAALGPLSGFLARIRDIRVGIEPDFLDATLELDSRGTLRMIPLRMAIIVLGLLFSPPIWRGIRVMRSTG